MKTMQRYAFGALAAAVLLGAGGCSGMSQRDQNTAVGAGVGAVGVPSSPAAARSAPSAARQSAA